jgi:hypothetical protein
MIGARRELFVWGGYSRSIEKTVLDSILGEYVLIYNNFFI